MSASFSPPLPVSGRIRGVGVTLPTRVMGSVRLDVSGVLSRPTGQLEGYISTVVVVGVEVEMTLTRQRVLIRL